MPITNWSTTGGDLRVPHFIGLHSIQGFVLTALVLAALAARVGRLRGERVRRSRAACRDERVHGGDAPPARSSRPGRTTNRAGPAPCLARSSSR